MQFSIFVPINTQIWAKLKNYGKFWNFVYVARNMMGLWATPKFCHFWSIWLLNKQIVAKFGQHSKIRLRISDKMSFHRFMVFIPQILYCLYFFVVFAVLNSSKSEMWHEMIKICRKQTNCTYSGRTGRRDTCSYPKC